MHSSFLTGLSARELIAPSRITNTELRNRALVYVSQAEISGLVGVDRATIFRWRKQFDDFPTAIRVGRTLRFKLLEFEEWMVAHSEASK